jgi:hypothetical protein
MHSDLVLITLNQGLDTSLGPGQQSSEILFISTKRIRSYGLDKLGRTQDGQRHIIIRHVWRQEYKNVKFIRNDCTLQKVACLQKMAACIQKMVDHNSSHILLPSHLQGKQQTEANDKYIPSQIPLVVVRVVRYWAEIVTLITTREISIPRAVYIWPYRDDLYVTFNVQTRSHCVLNLYMYIHVQSVFLPLSCFHTGRVKAVHCV